MTKVTIKFSVLMELLKSHMAETIINDVLKVGEIDIIDDATGGKIGEIPYKKNDKLIKKDIYFDHNSANLFISLQENGKYISTILYYEKMGSWSKGSEIIMDFKIESFVGDSAKDAQEKAEVWFSKNITDKYTIK